MVAPSLALRLNDICWNLDGFSYLMVAGFAAHIWMERLI